jgi:hypothetical protein
MNVIDERRMKWVMVNARDVFEWFTFGLKRKLTYRYICVPKIVGDKFPPDTTVVEMREFPLSRSLGFLVAHPSFEKIPLGQEIPRDEGSVSFEYERYELVQPQAEKQESKPTRTPGSPTVEDIEELIANPYTPSTEAERQLFEDALKKVGGKFVTFPETNQQWCSGPECKPEEDPEGPEETIGTELVDGLMEYSQQLKRHRIKKPSDPKPEPVPPVSAGLPVYANKDGSLFFYDHKTGAKTPILQKTIEFLVH